MWRPEWWPFARGPQFLIRLGQAEFQLWQDGGPVLALLASRSSSDIRFDQHDVVLSELVALIQSASVAGARVKFLLDSKWMPVTLLNTGRAPLSRTQVEALAAHRFSELFGERADEPRRIQVSYVAGDVSALAFSCLPGLHEVLRKGLGMTVMGVQPSFSWAWNRVMRSRSSGSVDCFVLAEHDRSVVAHLSSGNILALNGAAPAVHGASDLSALFPLEAWRSGLVEAPKRMVGVTFEQSQQVAEARSVGGAQWLALGKAEVSA